MRLETVSGSNPTGTLVAAGAEGTHTIVASTGVKEITFTTPLTVTAGDVIAVVIYCHTYVAAASLGIILTGAGFLHSNAAGLPGIRANTGFVLGTSTGWTVSSSDAAPAFTALYSDGEPLLGAVIPGGASVATTTIPSSGSDSYLGLKFSPDANCNLEYVSVCGRNDGSSYFQLYDMSNTLLGTSITLAAGVIANNNSNSVIFRFTTPITMTGGQTYRLVQRNISGSTNQVSLQLKDSAMLASLFGSVWCRTTSSDGVNWTDDTTGIAPNVMPFVTMSAASGGLILPRAQNGGYSA